MAVKLQEVESLEDPTCGVAELQAELERSVECVVRAESGETGDGARDGRSMDATRREMRDEM